MRDSMPPMPPHMVSPGALVTNGHLFRSEHAPVPADAVVLGDVLLLVEEDTVAEALTRLLKAITRRSIQRVSTCAEAEVALATDRYQLTVVDPAVSDAASSDVVGRLRAVCPQQVIVVVADHAEAVAAEALSHGAQEVLDRRNLRSATLQQALLRAALRGHASQELSYRATHDALTGLHNAPTLRSSLAAATNRAASRSSACALLYIDLDEFKPVNDRYGHEAGDEVLRIVATRLRGTLRGRDLAARIGGDEFVVVLQDVDDPEFAQRAAQRILQAVTAPIRLADRRDVRVCASIGIAIGPREGESASQLLGRADAAMFQAKAHGRRRAWMG